MSNQCLGEGKEQPTGGALPNEAQDAVGLLCHEGAMLAYGQLVHQDY